MKKMVNPLDTFFDTPPIDIEDNAIVTTEGALANIQGTEAPPEKDAEDVQIDSKIDEVYDAAMQAYNTQTQFAEILEPRYAARNGEVAANFLNIALNAASVRAKVKGDRKKNAQFIPFTNNKASGTVVASREDIMKMLAIDADTK